MSERISCCVPGCRRSMINRAGYAEWLCSRHWHCIDIALREEFKRIKQTRRRARARGANGATMHQIILDFGRAWKALVADATIKTALNVEGTRPYQNRRPPA